MVLRLYQGRCHCAAVRFEVTADLDRTIVCNCSLCEMRGFRWTFVPRSDFRMKSGAEHLVEYRFHEHVIDHLFCVHCGIEPFAFSTPEAGPTAMINVKCLDGVDLAALSPPVFYDGRSR